jgi:hypothetical protein
MLWILSNGYIVWGGWELKRKFRLQSLGGIRRCKRCGASWRNGHTMAAVFEGQKRKLRLSFFVAAILSAFYLATSVYIGFHRLFWFDEILTVHVAGLRYLVTILDALGHGADGMPAGYYIVVSTAQKLLGSSEVAARLPSAVALAAGLLVTFDCARRLTDGLHGLIALAVLTCSCLPYYGYEARSYAIYFMLAALSLWIWTCTADHRGWSAIAFGALLFLAVTIHYYAVLLLVPYGLWELYCWKPLQPPSPKLTAGLLGVAFSTALMSKLMLSYSHQFSAVFWAAPSFHAFRATFSELFPDGLFMLVLVIVWITVAALRGNESIGLNRRQAGESVGWLFLCIPMAGFALAKWKTNAFLSRYFIGALPGIAVAFSCLLWRHLRTAHRVSLGVFLIMTTWGVAIQFKMALHPDSADPSGRSVRTQQTKTRHYLGLETPLRDEGKRFLVFSNSILHMEVAQYSKHPDDCVLLLPSDPTHLNMQNSMEFKLAQYYPLEFWTFDDLKMHASEVALIEPGPDILDELRQAGFKITVRFPKPMEIVYLQ